MQTLPPGYTLEKRDPSTLTKFELDTMLRILKDGAAVNIRSARVEIPQATRLVLLKSADGQIVGLGTVKQERVWYAEDLQSPKKSGHSFDSKMLELGYVVVAVGHRDQHLSSHVVDALLIDNDDALFATTDHLM